MVTLAALPSRETSAGQISNAAYLIALDGVTRYGLHEAVKAILKNALGHAFFPSPPEIRGQCDAAMDWHERAAERIRRRERENADFRNQQGGNPPPSEESKARVRALAASLHDSGRKAAEDMERAEIRARYGMTDEVLAAIKDQPVPSNFKQIKAA